MYFGGDPDKTSEATNHKRLGVKGKSRYAWSRFHSQADVLIDTRRTTDLCGHIIELVPAGTEGSDGGRGALYKADSFRWEVLLGGDPAKPEHGARYHPDTKKNGNWLAAPDNCCFDNRGRLWITADQGSGQRKTGIPDGVHACDVNGAGRGLTKFFYACPRDAEICGPAFTPANRTLFVAVQHPSEDKDSTFDNPSTRWPDFDFRRAQRNPKKNTRDSIVSRGHPAGATR